MFHSFYISFIFKKIKTILINFCMDMVFYFTWILDPCSFLNCEGPIKYLYSSAGNCSLPATSCYPKDSEYIAGKKLKC